jgi:hypothetical protein
MSTAAASPQPPPLRRQPVPVTQPHPALRVVRDEPDSVPAAQGVLALALAPTDIDDSDRNNGRDSTIAGDPARRGRAATDGLAARRPPCGPALPEPRRWAAQFVQAAIEVTTGLRPPSQLLRWTSDEVQAMLARRAELARQAAHRGRTPRRGVVRSTRVCIPRDGVAEACAVVADGTRVRAVALRLEGVDGRWRATALQIG